MNKECEYTRKSLDQYLHGYLFSPRKRRIDRHLRDCVVCRSEFEVLKRSFETRLFMKDFAPARGMSQRMKEMFSGLARLRRVFYRPLWIAGFALLAAAAYYYAMMQRQLDLELDSIVKTTPQAVSSAPVPTAIPPVVPPEQQPVTASTSSGAGNMVSPAAVLPAQDALIVLITAEDDQTAIQRINDVMRGHHQLRRMKLSDTDREVSGSLTPDDLRILFERLAEAGKVTYNHKRFASFPDAQPIPFTLKLNAASRTPGKSRQQPMPARKSAAAKYSDGSAVPSLPATAPTLSAAP
jgi:hypothetical protein